jgi:hypothetical protein
MSMELTSGMVISCMVSFGPATEPSTYFHVFHVVQNLFQILVGCDVGQLPGKVLLTHVDDLASLLTQSLGQRDFVGLDEIRVAVAISTGNVGIHVGGSDYRINERV